MVTNIPTNLSVTECANNMKAMFIHPNENRSGNIFWPIKPTFDELERLHKAREAIASLGYWASFFPEGDGITFSKSPYEPKQGLKDFSRCFDFVDFHVAPGYCGNTLAALEPEKAIETSYLVPVTGLQLTETIQIGKTLFHAPVDGINVYLADHPWGMKLCDVPGADVESNWRPYHDLKCGTLANLLAYPLIERKIMIPSKLLYEASVNICGQERLLNFITQDADRALDLLRWGECSYTKLEYLPNRAGWVDDFSHAYILPSFGKLIEHCIAKPHVLRVVNNWIGLEVTWNKAEDDLISLADIIDGTTTNLLALEVKSALRTFGQAFYLIDPEASFLSMVYAIDALCDVEGLRGPHQRAWVAATASGGDAIKFNELLSKYDFLYSIRNEIVHSGQTFASLNKDFKSINQQIATILCSVISKIISAKHTSRVSFKTQIYERLQQDDHDSILQAKWPEIIGSPISTDKTFRKYFLKKDSAK